jgi:alpha-N-arabinofuranosidase
VGNENWGCGGQMRAEYYTDEYRRFQNYCRNFARKPLYTVACGFNEPWNEVLLREAGRMMGGLSVHYYTSIRSRRGSQQSGSATKFAATDWFNTFRRALGIEDFILRTEKIMDQYDPQRRVGIVMDEWGTWFDVEPDTNPGFLYQQNTLRDALVAGLSLNLFNNHANRVFMANIAQTINVLQSMILTDGPRMLRTPTYHVFEMYKVHQEATLLPTTLDCAQYEMGNGKIPQLSASASRDKDGKVHLSLCNLHHEEAADLTCDLRGLNVTAGTGRILTAGEMNIHNTFDKPDTLQPAAFDGFKLARNALTVRLPARSVMMIELA